MKKLLSLLSVLTISGTAVPTTIAASPYQKEEQLNNEINYSKINNNLENFNTKRRTKRAVHKCNKIEINENKDFIKQKSNIINEKLNLNLNWTGEIWLNFNHKDMEFTSQYYYNKDGVCYYMIDINVEKINPGDYNSIFFGDRGGNTDPKNMFTYATWGNTRLQGHLINDVLKDRDLREIMPNIKVENNDTDISKHLPLSLQYVKDYKEGLAYVSVSQELGLTYYYNSKEKAYHIQVLIGQYAGAISSFSGGMLHLGIGAYFELGKL